MTMILSGVEDVGIEDDLGVVRDLEPSEDTTNSTKPSSNSASKAISSSVQQQQQNTISTSEEPASDDSAVTCSAQSYSTLDGSELSSDGALGKQLAQLIQAAGKVGFYYFCYSMFVISIFLYLAMFLLDSNFIVILASNKRIAILHL